MCSVSFVIIPSIQLTSLFCSTADESLFLFMPGVPRDSRNSSSSPSSFSAGFSNIFPFVIFVVVAFAVLKTFFKELCNSSAFWSLEGSLSHDACLTDLSMSLSNEFETCFRIPLELSRVFVSKFCWLFLVLFSTVGVSLGMEVGSVVDVVLVFLVSVETCEGIDWSFLHNSAFVSNSLTRSGWEKTKHFSLISLNWSDDFTQDAVMLLTGYDKI